MTIGLLDRAVLSYSYNETHNGIDYANINREAGRVIIIWSQSQPKSERELS